MAAAFFTLGVLCSYLFLHFYPLNDKTEQAFRPLQLGKSGLINPLLDYVSPGPDTKNGFPELKLLENELKLKINAALLDKNANGIGVYFRDLQTGRWTGVNETEKFSPASLLKVPLMMTYFKLADMQPEVLKRLIIYDGSFDDNLREDIKPVKSVEAGKSYTVDQLIKFMISYSDNNATFLLYTHIDNDLINKTYTDISLPVPESPSNFLGPKAYSLFFRVLYNATYLNNKFSEKALELLTANDFPQGIQGGIPENIISAEKFGEHAFPDGTKELHNCGIVYQSQHPYFLCIMTKGSDFIKLGNIIRDLSGLVYKTVNNNYKN